MRFFFCVSQVFNIFNIFHVALLKEFLSLKKRKMEALAMLFVLVGVAVILGTTLTANTTTTPDPILTAMATNEDLVDFTAAPTFVKFEGKGIQIPSNFQTAPDTFVIPKSGNYRISSNIVVTEVSGSATNVLYYAQVNGVTNYVLGFGTVRENGGGTFGGDVIVEVKAGDIVKMVISQYFAASSNIGYDGITATPTETFNLTNVSFQYIKP